MHTEQLDAGLFRTDAPSGLTVVTERMPGLRSAAVGIWVRTASVHERPAKMGVSHLLEHMVFKGTATRSARQIAMELETRGGSLDAYTGRDHTSYQARILDEDLPTAIDILTDLVSGPRLDAEDLALERQVVLEEIAMVDDTPDDLVFDLHALALWPEHPYGYRILGTRDTVGGLERDDLRQLHGDAYYPGNCVVSAAGNVEHEAILELLGERGWMEEPARAPRAQSPTATPSVRGADEHVERDLHQTHIVVGTDSVPRSDRRRLAVTMLSSVLGGGMSSRLFQKVREQQGLAYAVYTFQSFFSGTGTWGVYVGTKPEWAERAMETIRGELSHVASEGLDATELDDAKRQLKGQVTLSSESPTARMYRLAAFPLYDEPYRSLDQLLADIDGFAVPEVADVAKEFFAPERQTTVWLGPAKGARAT